MKTLLGAPLGETQVIKWVGGSSEETRLLKELGFITGAQATVLSVGWGNLIIRIHNSRIGISSELAFDIKV